MFVTTASLVFMQTDLATEVARELLNAPEITEEDISFMMNLFSST